MDPIIVEHEGMVSAYQVPESAAETVKEMAALGAAGRLSRGSRDGILLDGMPVILSDESRRQLAAAKVKRERKAARR